MNAGGMGSSETVYFELTDAFTSAPFPKADFRFGSILLQKSKIEQPEKSRKLIFGLLCCSLAIQL